MKSSNVKLLSRVVAFIIILSILLTTLAGAVDVASSNAWDKSESKTNRILMSRSDAYTTVTREMTVAYDTCIKELSSNDGCDEYKVMLNYGIYLMCMHWITSNVQVHSGSDSFQISILESPTNNDVATAASLIGNAEYLRSAIQAKGFLDSVTSISDKTYNSYDTFGVKLPGETVLSSGNFISNSSYGTALDNLIYNYIEGNVLVIILNHYEDIGEGLSLSQLRDKMSTHITSEWGDYTEDSWVDEIFEAKAPDDLVSLVSEVKEEIRPYMDIYSNLVTRHADLFSMALMNETASFEDTEYSLTGYTRDYSLAVNTSTILSALYRYIYNAGNSDSADGSYVGVVDNSDIINGAFGILTGGKLEDGKVIFEDSSDEEATLTDAGKYILASGVIYDPFVSKAGNETYLELVSQFLASDQEKVTAALQTAVSLKKPLYVASLSKSGQDYSDIETMPSSNYTIAYLSDMLDIRQNKLNVFACVRGKMEKSEVDASTWDYVQGGTVTQVVESDDEDTDNAAGEVTTEVQVADGSFSTPGTTELFAAGNQMTAPIAITTGSSSAVLDGRVGGEAAEIGGLTALILHNASRDAQSSEYIKNSEIEMLFLNGLGDIVLADGTIVLPAIANPVLYTDSESNVDSVDDLVAEANNALLDLFLRRDGYYPYNAAFLNHYPKLFSNTESKAECDSTSDEGKYVIINNKVLLQNPFDEETADSVGATRISKVKGSGNATTAKTDRIETYKIASNSFSVTDVDTDYLSLFTWMEASSGSWLRWFISEYTMKYYVFESAVTSEGITFFPLIDDSPDVRESFLKMAAPLVTSAVRFIDSEDETPGTSFSTYHYIYDFIAEGLQGTVYSETLVKNYQRSYEEILENQYGFFTNFVVDAAEDFLDTFGRIDGVLALKNGYENGFFNSIVHFVQNYYLMIAVALVAILAVKFLRGRYSLVYIVFLSLVTFAIFELYAMWMPSAVPSIYNFFVNDIVEGVSWKAVTVAAEDYASTYQDSDRVDSLTGEPQPYTATITLYRMSQAEMNDFCEQSGVSLESLRSGEIIYLDQDAGIFAQGDAIKMSLDKLFVNNTMRGLYTTQWEEVESGAEEVSPIDELLTNNPYIIKLTNTYSSLEGYYTPYNMIQRAFLVNLNNFVNIFMVERNYYNYGDSLYKDAFVFNAFTNSGIFTAPGNDEVLEENIRVSTITGQPAATVEDVLTLTHRYFDPQEDWLNLRSIFADPTDELKESHWGKSLQDAGYYDSNWEMDEDQEVKMTSLISYINDQTKKFVIENQDMLKFCSDENVIKIVSLYATTCFTHKVSEIGSWLYPNYINAADIELTDVLYGAMTSLDDRVVASDGGVVNTVTVNLGLGGAVLVLLITVFSVVFIFILTYLVPALYALLGVIFVYKLLNDEQSIGLVKGYFKVTLSTTLIYIIYSFGLRLVEIGGYKWYGYLACALLSAACIYFLLFIILAVITNPLEIGNDTLARSLRNALNRLTGGRLERVLSKSTHIYNQSYRTGFGVAASRSFLRNAPVDDRYTKKRSEHYGRWSDFDDQNMSRRAQVIHRFGKLNQHAEEVGKTKTGFRQTRIMRTWSNAKSGAKKIFAGVTRSSSSDDSET